MLLYYITDRKQFAGDAAAQRTRLLDRIVQAATAGVDYIQLREKDLGAGELERLAREALDRVRETSSKTGLLINSRTDIAIAAGLDGVHLTSADLNAGDVRAIHAKAAGTPGRVFTVAASCHSVDEVRRAESHGADFVVLAPIFEKIATAGRGIGLEQLRAATRQGSPPDQRVEAGDHRVGISVLALGGVTLANAAACMQSGATGVAGIRLFQQGDVAETVNRLRRIK